MNNFGVQSFLQDHNFTKDCARPPAIGEENEVTSVDGRMSTHSSVSGKSEVSSATPRRTDIDLGFEPEGSASPLPMCDRWRSSLHNVLDDSEGIRLFKQFLADSKQAALLDCWLACKGFRDFGIKNNYSNNSSAASSTTGPLTAQRTQMDITTLQKRGKLAKTIFNTFIKKSCSPAVSSVIKDATRQYIYKQVKNALQNMSSGFELDASLFDQAQNEIELSIEGNSYVSFLNSELLRKYAAQCETKHTKQPTQAMLGQNQSENKNTSSNAQQVAVPAEPASTGHYVYLPHIDEDEVWHPPVVRSKSESESVSKDRSLNSTMSSVGSKSSLARVAMEQHMAASHERRNCLDGSDQSRPAHPYLAAWSAPKYYVPPASANASDNASSDATSDTLSITDGSIDLERNSTYSSKKNQKRLIRHHAKRNPLMHHAAEENFVSLTRRCQYKQTLANLATENPSEFFAQLKEKLDRVVEERRKKEREIMEATTLDNVDDILDSHLERVMKTPNPVDSPNRNQSPPPNAGTACSRNNSQTRNLNFSSALPPEMHSDNRNALRPPQKDAFDHAMMSHRASNMDHSMVMSQKRMDSLRRRGKEVAVGMAPNEVPDVEVPARPVDKNSFISEWIKQQDNSKAAQPLCYGSQPRRGSVSKSGKSSKYSNPSESSKYINPSDSFPTRSSATSKINPLLDAMMPLLSQPDPSTMLDEVKRRLIEETESGYVGENFPQHSALTHSNPYTQAGGSNTAPPVSMGTHSVRDAVFRQNSQPGYLPGSSSSSGVGTAPSDGRGDGPHVGRTNSKKTTCIYYMPGEDKMAYKTQIPHSSPVTLGQFKSYFRRKGNFRYFFKQYSEEIRGPVKFEIRDDDEVLPLWENVVVVEIKNA